MGGEFKSGGGGGAPPSYDTIYNGAGNLTTQAGSKTAGGEDSHEIDLALNSDLTIDIDLSADIDLSFDSDLDIDSDLTASLDLSFTFV